MSEEMNKEHLEMLRQDINSGRVMTVTVKHYEQITQQRDELLEACKETLRLAEYEDLGPIMWADKYGPESKFPTVDDRNALIVGLYAIIAKCEKG